jgi:hypothetical protein
MENSESELLALPAGFFAVRQGGRPKKEGRDAAVFLARVHRVEIEGGAKVRGAVARADAWIVAEWQHLGIREAAHVRAAIKRARKNGLNKSLLIHDHKTDIWTAVECDAPRQKPPEDGDRSWHWKSGMKAAAEGRVKNSQERVVEEPAVYSPIAGAIRTMANR